jgi:uncharacterized membrane protein HdeD (DUF308 family)
MHGHGGMVESTRAPESRAVPLVDLDAVHEGRGWFIGLGIAFLVLGMLSIFLPLLASLATTVVIGWLLVLGGLSQGYHALQNPRWGGRGWAFVGALVHVLAGLLVILFPVVGTMMLTLILASFLAASGILKIVRGIQHKRLPAWGWLVFDGVLSLVLGGMILLGWPSTAVWALGLLVGIDLVFSGSSMLVLGVTAGQLARVR